MARVAGGSVARTNIGIGIHVLLTGESHVGCVTQLRVTEAVLCHQDAQEAYVAAIPSRFTGAPAREFRDLIVQGIWKLNTFSTLIGKIMEVISSGTINSTSYILSSITNFSLI